MSYQKVIDLLAETKEQASSILGAPDQEHHRLTIESTIDRLIRNIGFSTKSTIGEISKPSAPGPATTIAGKVIPTRNDVKRSDLEPGEEKVRVLRMKVEELYPQFLNIESLELLREYDENLIRGVAKKAKMKVTKDEPEEITLDFIEEVKANIRLQQKRELDMANLKAVDNDGQEEKNTGEQDQKDKNNPDPHYNKNSGEWENLPDASEVREEKGIKTPDVTKTAPTEEKRGKRK